MTTETLLELVRSQLNRVVGVQMEIRIDDRATDAEPVPAPAITRHLSKWEFTEEQEHVRLYFNPCHFIAIPLVRGKVSLIQEADGGLRFHAEDEHGKLRYLISFAHCSS